MHVLSFVLVLCAVSEARYQLAHPPAKGSNGKTEFFDTYLFEQSTNAAFGFSVPLFSVTVPGYGSEHKEIDQFRDINFGNMALLGVVVIGTLSLMAPLFTSRAHWISNPLSALSTGSLFRSRRDVARSLLMSSTTNYTDIIEQIVLSVDSTLDLVQFPGMSGRECLKRVICEAHESPSHYGWIGNFVRLAVPPRRHFTSRTITYGVLSNSTATDEGPLVAYRDAATVGWAQRERHSSNICALQYGFGCGVSPFHMNQLFEIWQ